MKDLVNNPYKYFIGRYIMPFLGYLFNVITLGCFFDYTYFYFCHHLSYCIYKDLLNSNRSSIDVNNWRNHKICLWDDLKTITIHDLNGKCVISTFSCSLWDRKLNREIYYFLK
jgi:hypothetical protein